METDKSIENTENDLEMNDHYENIISQMFNDYETVNQLVAEYLPDYINELKNLSGEEYQKKMNVFVERVFTEAPVMTYDEIQEMIENNIKQLYDK